MFRVLHFASDMLLFFFIMLVFVSEYIVDYVADYNDHHHYCVELYNAHPLILLNDLSFLGC